MKKFIHTFIPAILAGVCIALGGTVFLSSDTKLAGSLFFCLGLLTILTCGFEHCVADMFYFFLAGEITPDALLRIIVISLGNSVGGMLIPAAEKLYKRKS